MINVIKELLLNSDLLLSKLKYADKDIRIDFVTASWNPSLKWTYLSTAVAVDDAFLMLLKQWIMMQKKDCSYFRPENKGKSSQILLSELFGTTEFSTLKLQEMKDENLLQKMEKVLIWDDFNEIRRQKEIKSLKKAVVVNINCKTGDILYFGKTTLFYFLISKEYMQSRTLPIYYEIHQLISDSFDLESMRKRPGMYIGSTGEIGLCRLLSGLIEDLLKDATEKVISMKLLPQNVFEITCKSYLLKNNTCDYNHLPIVNGLSEYFVFQNECGKISTKKGVFLSYDREDVSAAGVHIIFKTDEVIFNGIVIEYYTILSRMTELAILNLYTIYISDSENQNKLWNPSGIACFLKRNIYGLSGTEIISISITEEQFKGNIAVSFSAFHAETRLSYVNSQLTQDGGTHVEGLMNGAYKAFKKLRISSDNQLTPNDLIKADIRNPLTLLAHNLSAGVCTPADRLNHLNYVIHIQTDHPRYDGSTKRKLKNLEFKLPIQKQVERELYDVLSKNIRTLK